MEALESYYGIVSCSNPDCLYEYSFFLLARFTKIYPRHYCDRLKSETSILTWIVNPVSELFRGFYYIPTMRYDTMRDKKSDLHRMMDALRHNVMPRRLPVP